MSKLTELLLGQTPVEARLEMIDRTTGEQRASAVDLLKRLHEGFPLNEAKMGEDFKGTHSLTLTAEGKLIAAVWWEGKCWPVVFD